MGQEEGDVGQVHGDDASGLVDRRIVKISPYAPLLTAHCIFQEKPMLEYIVCYDKHWEHKFAVLSRSDFELSLTATCYALAHTPHAQPGMMDAGLRQRSEVDMTEMSSWG